jgi:hypothetical protein
MPVSPTISSESVRNYETCGKTRWLFWKDERRRRLVMVICVYEYSPFLYKKCNFNYLYYTIPRYL